MSVKSAIGSKRNEVLLYGRVERVLRQRIASGEWKPGDFIPTIESLMAEFSVGRKTVRQALSPLIAEKLIESVRGKGTYVLDQDIPEQPASVENVPGLDIEIHSIKNVTELPDILEKGLKLTGDYIRICKTHKVNGQTRVYMDLYVSSHLKGLITEDALKKETMYGIMQEKLFSEEIGTHQRMSIEVADQKIADHINRPIGEQMVTWRRVYFEEATRKFLYFGQFYYLSEYYQSDFACNLKDLHKAIGYNTAIGVRW